MEKYTINLKGSKKLCSFYFNDLPISGKREFSESKNRLVNIFSPKNIFVFDNCNYMFFNSKEEATGYLQHIKQEIKENRERYETALEGSTDKLLKYADGLKVVTECKPILNCNCAKYQTSDCAAKHEQALMDFCSHGIRKPGGEQE